MLHIIYRRLSLYDQDNIIYKQSPFWYTNCYCEIWGESLKVKNLMEEVLYIDDFLLPYMSSQLHEERKLLTR